MTEPLIIIGIDPGLSGGIAVLNGYHGPVSVEPIRTQKSKSGRLEYNIHGIVSGLRPGSEEIRRRVRAFVEKVGPMPPMIARGGGGFAGNGGIANYQRGRASMLFEALLAALGIEYHLVGPKQWQDEMLPLTGGDTKARSIIRARELFPDVSLFASARSRKASDGLADALLLAEHGRRKLSKEGR